MPRPACVGRAIPVGDPRALASQTALGACVALPDPEQTLYAARHRRLAMRLDTPMRLRVGADADWIPRLPDRPAEYTAYLLPVEQPLDVAPWSTGDDSLAEPALEQRGIRIDAAPHAAVGLATLESQESGAEVVAVGELYGVTVVTRHVVHAASGARRYLVFSGNLSRPGPHVLVGARLADTDIVGYTSSDDSPGGAYVYLEIRRERPSSGADADADGPAALAAPSVSIATDPRNVLAPR